MPYFKLKGSQEGLQMYKIFTTIYRTLPPEQISSKNRGKKKNSSTHTNFLFTRVEIMKQGVIIGVVVVLAMVQLMIEPSQAITCTDVTKNLAQCTPYITGAADEPTSACCDGVTTLKGMASTTADERAACHCIKQAASKIQNIKDAAAAALPSKCNAPLPYPITKNFDCDSIP